MLWWRWSQWLCECVRRGDGVVPLDLHYYCFIYLPFIDGDMPCLHTSLKPYLLTKGGVYNDGDLKIFQSLPHTRI